MKKLNTLLLIAPLMVSILAGCGNTGISDQEAVDTVSGITTLLLNNRGEIKESNFNYTPKIEESFVGLASHTVQNKTVTITWTSNAGDKVAIAPKSGDPLHVTITPTYPLMPDDCYLLELTATIASNNASTTKKYNFNITNYKYEELTLKELRDKCGKSTVSLDTNYHFNGIVSGLVDTATKNIKAGVFLQDGPYAIKLSDGCLKTEGTWKQNWGVGTKLRVFGKAFRYNGLHYVEPETIEEVTDDTLTTPTTYVVENGDVWNPNDMWNQDTRLAYVKNASYKSGKENAKTSINYELTFTIKDTQNNDVDVIVKVFKALGSEQMSAIKDLVDELEVGDTYDIYGVLDWNGGPKILPMNIANRTAVQCFVAK